jgi:hypothetical protein
LACIKYATQKHRMPAGIQSSPLPDSEGSMNQYLGNQNSASQVTLEQSSKPGQT